MQDYLQALQPYLIPGFTAFGLTLLFSFLALVIFPKLGLMDRPHLYGHKRAPIPYSGGLVLFLVFLICIFLFFDLNKRLIGLILAATMVVGVSFWDDRKNLSPFFRLFVQFLVAVTLILSGIGITSITNPLGGIIALDTYQIPITLNETVYHFTILADLFTIVWVMLLMNTVNWLDGLPGLVSGISGIAAVILFILSVRPDFHFIDQTQVATLAIVLVGMCFAFWGFDMAPPKMLMGDTGSMFLGFLLGTLAIFSGAKIATALLIMGLPILDLFWVIARRIWQGKSPFSGDFGHLHHRFVKAGFSKRQTIFTLYTICALFGVVALFLGSHQKMIAIGVLVLMMVVLGLVIVGRGRATHGD